MDFLRLTILLSNERSVMTRSNIKTNLNETEAKICFFIHQNPCCSQDEVARALELDKTTIAKSLLSLEQKNLVARNVDKQDRRKKMLTITPEGVELSKHLLTAHKQWMDDIFSCLSDEERATFNSYCSRILAAAEERFAKKHETDD